MRYKRLSKLVFALSGTMLLTTSTAGAHSGHGMTVIASDTNTDAYSNLTFSLSTGVEDDVVTIDFPAGWRLAHDDQYGTEITPNPNDEEQIGSGQKKATWFLVFCSTSTQSLTLTWEEDMTGGPTGAVAHWVMTTGLGFDTHAWVIEENDATDDYKVTFDVDDSMTCSPGPTDGFFNFTINGTTASGGHPHRNPAVAGCYTFGISFTDSSGGGHGSSATVPIGGASC